MLQIVRSGGISAISRAGYCDDVCVSSAGGIRTKCSFVTAGDMPIIAGDTPIIAGDTPIIAGDTPIIAGDTPIIGVVMFGR